MRIATLTHNYPRFAGDFSGTFVEALCEEFARQGHAVDVHAPHDPAYARALSSRALGAGPEGSVTLRLYRYAWPARFEQLGYMRSMQSDLALRLNSYVLSPAFFAAGTRHLLRAARRTRPDVLHAHWLLPNGFIAAIAARRMGIPLVISVPGSDAQVAAANPLFRAMARTAFRRAGLLTANSAELRDAVVALGADPSKFDLILYGTNPDALRPAHDTPEAAALRGRWRARLGVAEMRPLYLLAVGRMVPKKGFDVLLHALAEPALRARPVYAILVGTGDAQEEWQRLAAALHVADRVLWAGTVPKTEIGLWYNAADVLVMPSVSNPADGLNVCVLDAMSCARPVVASTVAGNPLAVVHGETGFLVPEQEPAALAEALAVLADAPELRAAFGAAGRRRIENELGWPPLAQRYLAHFRRLSGAPIHLPAA